MKCLVGQEEYDKLRPFSFDKLDVLLIGFSIDNPRSLENVQGKWISEALCHCSDVPIIMVGMKSDLRDKPGVKTLSYEEVSSISLL
jgi:Rho family, other